REEIEHATFGRHVLLERGKTYLANDVAVMIWVSDKAIEVMDIDGAGDTKRCTCRLALLGTDMRIGLAQGERNCHGLVKRNACLVILHFRNLRRKRKPLVVHPCQ